MECSLPLPERVKRGDVKAFAPIFDQYHSRIYRYLRRLVGDPELAEDLAQQTFVKAYKALSAQGSEPENLRAWLYTIATNTALSALRRRRLIAWLPLHPDRQPAPTASGREQEARIGERELLAQALGRLPKKDAACLLLHFQQGLTCAELSEILGVSLSAAKMRLYRARAAFCEAYLHLSQEVNR
jgi:RNA polymerase sigma-70 factor (ECF subfamily)